MTADEIQNIHPIQSTGPATENVGNHPVEATDSAEFRRILERLEQISKKKLEAKPPDDTKEFRDAMKKADDDFVSVMDLRRQLEHAYRKHQP